MKFIVDVCDDPGEDSRGYIGEASEGDPNGGAAPREFGTGEELREAIGEVIAVLGPSVSFSIEPSGGGGNYGCVYFLDDEWMWELPEGL